MLLCPEKDIERAICYLPRQPQLAIVCELDLTVLQCCQKDPGLVVLVVFKALKPSVALLSMLSTSFCSMHNFPFSSYMHIPKKLAAQCAPMPAFARFQAASVSTRIEV